MSKSKQKEPSERNTTRAMADRDASPDAVQAVQSPEAVPPVPKYGPCYKITCMSPLERLRAILNLSATATLDQVLSDAVNALEEKKRDTYSPPGVMGRRSDLMSMV